MAKRAKKAKLTDKQQAFCEEYMIDLNATQAALRAGYKCKNDHVAQVIGWDNLLKPVIKNEIIRLKANISKKTGITVEWVVNNLKEVAERCMNAVPVFDSEGNETGEWEFDAGGANRALQLLGMHVGAFEADKQKPADIRIFNLTQLTAIIDADKAKAEEIDCITGGIAGESITGQTGGL